MSVLVLIEAKAKPEQRSALVDFLLGNMYEIVEAKGCESVKFHENQEDPNTLLFVEYWDERTSYEEYLAWRYERGDHSRMVSMMDGEVSVRVFNILR